MSTAIPTRAFDSSYTYVHISNRHFASFDRWFATGLTDCMNYRITCFRAFITKEIPSINEILFDNALVDAT